MKPLSKEIKEVIGKSEIVAIATAGPDGPHVAATWGAFVLYPDDDGKTLLIPAGGYKLTEKNLQENSRIVLLVGSKEAPGKKGMGTGFRLTGVGKIADSGSHFDLMKEKYVWIRAVLVVEVEQAEQLL